MKPVILLIPISLLSLIIGCRDRVTNSDPIEGASKGTIAGRVLDTQGNGVANARVHVLTVNFNPGPGRSGSSDSETIVLTGADGNFLTATGRCLHPPGKQG